MTASFFLSNDRRQALGVPPSTGDAASDAAPDADAALTESEWLLCVEVETSTFVAALLVTSTATGRSTPERRAIAVGQRVTQLLVEFHDSLTELGLSSEVALVAMRQLALLPIADRLASAEMAVALTRSLPARGTAAVARAIAAVHAAFPFGETV